MRPAECRAASLSGEGECAFETWRGMVKERSLSVPPVPPGHLGCHLARSSRAPAPSHRPPARSDRSVRVAGAFTLRCPCDLARSPAAPRRHRPLRRVPRTLAQRSTRCACSRPWTALGGAVVSSLDSSQSHVYCTVCMRWCYLLQLHMTATSDVRVVRHIDCVHFRVTVPRAVDR